MELFTLTISHGIIEMGKKTVLSIELKELHSLISSMFPVLYFADLLMERLDFIMFLSRPQQTNRNKQPVPLTLRRG